MARQSKKQNEELLQQAYYAVIREYDLDQEAPVNDQVHCIIEWADEVQTDICQQADSIKIDAYEHIREDYPELGIPKPVWLELVNLRRLQRHTTLSDDYIAKIMQTFEGAKNVTAFRATMLEAIRNNTVDTVQVPTCDTEKTFDYAGAEQLSDDFIQTLNHCADIRHEIDSQLWPKMRLLGDAFCYLTKEPYGTFKHLLDLYHYRNGGWPKATTPPRIWSTIFRFMHEYDMLEQYSFDMASSWCKRMGLETKRVMHSPTMFTFTKEAEQFGKYFMCKLTDGSAAKYPQYDFQPWHHIIANSGTFFAYVWDTREIQFIGQTDDLHIEDLTTDYQDACTPIWSGNNEIQKLAEQLVPDACKSVKPAEKTKKSEIAKHQPQNFEQAVADRKAELAGQFSDSPEAQAIMETGVLEQYEAQHSHPEQGFSPDYSEKWKPEDLCHSEILGDGRVVGCNQETGELIVYFYKYDKEFPMWMWHLTKVEQQ